VAAGSARWRRGEGVRADAQAAKDAAAQAFYELDTVQRDVRLSVDAVSAADNSPGARRAIADFAALGNRIDEVSAAYISALDAHDLDAEDLDAGTAARARQQLEQSRQQLIAVKTELERYVSLLQPLVAAAETQLAQVSPAVERAKQAWLAASNALDAARAARLGTDELSRRLAALAPQLKLLGEGAGQHGVQSVLRTATDTQREAEAIRAEAEKLPEQARDIDHTLGSLRTRTQALETRSANIAPVLSELRRRFSTACWQDLQNVPEQTATAVRTAQTRLAEASKARDEQRWADATGILAATRTLLTTADGSVAVVNDRLHALNEAQRAPEAEIERTRFALRDAQRLAMTGRSAPDPRHAAPLDSAVVRLDRAAASLTGRHPDYWQFLTELAAVRETVAQVVTAIREERGSGAR
jgi:predicted  nucleic acid-binding Zn-ribbon protein